MIFFTYAIFIFHPDLEKSDLGEMVKIGMKAADYVVFIFSFLFVLYSVGSFLKARKKEFGLLTILGTERRQVKRLIFLENMIIGFAAIVTGLLGGLLLAKLFLLIGAKVLEMEELPFYLPWKAMVITITAFFGLFLFISLLTPLFVRQNRVLELLQGASKPKPEPKASILLALLSASSLIGAFYLMQKPLTEGRMLMILLLGLIGTYFFFTQLSVLVIRLLKKNRPFFWRGTNLLWISEMAYKMKDNARMFFMVTIVITMASSAVGLVLGLDQRNKQLVTENPFSFRYDVNTSDNWQPEKIDQELNREGVKYEKIKTGTLYLDFQETEGLGVSGVIRESDYNWLADVLQLEKVRPLHSGEAIAIFSEWGVEGIVKEARERQKEQFNHLRQLTLKKGTTPFTIIKKQIEKKRMVYGNGSNPLSIVVADSTFEQLKQNDSNQQERIWISYFVPAWYDHPSLRSNSLEAKLSKKLTEWGQSEQQKGETKGYFSSRIGNYLLMKQATNTMSFIGVFMAAIFSIFTASLLYFKLYTDLNQDRHIYYGLSKIGLSVKEMKKAATIQMVILFFIPLVVAALETVVILSTLGEEIAMGNTFIPAMIGIGCFFAAQLVYFFVIRSRYLNQLQQVMV